MHVTELWITIVLFVGVAGMGFVAANWRRPPHLHSLDEWSLAGRKFGSWLGWFMLGGWASSPSRTPRSSTRWCSCS